MMTSIRQHELEDAGLSPEEAFEAILEEQQLQKKEAKMARTDRQIGIHDGEGYTLRDLENAEPAEKVGSGRVPEPDVVFHSPQTSPTLRKWAAEEAARTAEREQREQEIRETARAELEAEAEEEKRRAEIERVKETMRFGTGR